ncbi:MAG: cytochrome b [Formivibrio sp.]|nr:cytochrome b [Formivibrio sp.]
MSNTHTRYGRVAQTLHWITATLVLTAFYFGPGGPELRVYAPARDFGRQFHETLGLCVFAVTLLRVLWLLVDERPPELPIARWMTVASKATQGLLYLLLFAVPLTAILGAWLEGHPLTLLTGLNIAPAIATSHDLGLTISSLHKLLGDLILWLAGLHACAALFHHVILKDQVLVSIMPKWLIGDRRQ